jgi:hypothetical protein
MMDRNDWAQSLKPGDHIAMRRGYGYATYQLLTVDRVTASQVVCGGYRFRKDTLRLVGGSSRYDSVYMLPATQEVRDAAEARELRDWLNGLTRTIVPLSVMRTMKAAFVAASDTEKQEDASAKEDQRG